MSLFLKRVISDFAGCAKELRRALNYKDALAKHQVCGAFLHFKEPLQAKCPEKEWADLSKEMDEAFFQKFLDAELLSALSSSVPPGDVTSISAFRQDCLKIPTFPNG